MALPAHDLPSWSAVFYYFGLWRQDGLDQRIQELLRCQVRERAHRLEDPSLVIIDAQSVRAAAGVPKATTGLDANTKVSGRKRGLAVDVMGPIIGVVVLAASAHDNAAGTALLDQAAERCGIPAAVRADRLAAGPAGPAHRVPGVLHARRRAGARTGRRWPPRRASFIHFNIGDLYFTKTRNTSGNVENTSAPTSAAISPASISRPGSAPPTRTTATSRRSAKTSTSSRPGIPAETPGPRHRPGHARRTAQGRRHRPGVPHWRTPRAPTTRPGWCSPCWPPLSGMEREYIRDRTLEGHESARKRGKTIGGAGVTDDAMLSMALHLRTQDLTSAYATSPPSSSSPLIRRWANTPHRPP